MEFKTTSLNSDYNDLIALKLLAGPLSGKSEVGPVKGNARRIYKSEKEELGNLHK